MSSGRIGPDAARRALVGVALVGLLAACGYQPLGMGSAPTSRRSLVVEAIANETLRPGIQGVVGAAILRQLHLHGIVSGAEAGPPELVLAGSVTGYQNEAIAFSVQDIGRRFRVRVTVSVTLSRSSDRTIRLKEAILGEAFYTTGAGAVSTRNAEDEALQRAAQDLADKLVARVLEEW